jgi:hypothetical protein
MPHHSACFEAAQWLGKLIAGLIDDKLFSFLECMNPMADEPLKKKDFLPG